MTPEEYKKLVFKRKARHEEADLQRAFGQRLDGYEKWGKLSPKLIKRSYIASGEARPGIEIEKIGKKGNTIKGRYSRVGADLKKKGLKKGLADYFFCIEKDGIACDIWLEAKSSTGKLTLEQIEFKNRINQTKNSIFLEFRTVEEGENILKRHGVLIE
jgi:hypothetical protein